MRDAHLPPPSFTLGVLRRHLRKAYPHRPRWGKGAPKPNGLAVSHQRSDPVDKRSNPVDKRSTVRAAKYDGTSVRDGNPADRPGAARGISEAPSVPRSTTARRYETAILWISVATLWVSDTCAAPPLRCATGTSCVRCSAGERSCGRTGVAHRVLREGSKGYYAMRKIAPELGLAENVPE